MSGPGTAPAAPPAVAEDPPAAAATALGRTLARGRVRGPLALLGPAVVAAVAYVDPGNFATNFSAGSQFGYLLVWVIVMANLMAMLVQYLSAKTGIASGRNLPELCRERFPKPVTRGLWVQAEIVAAATDLAEFVGAALGLNLLFGIPLFPAGLITAVVAFVILGLEQRGYRRFELAIIGLIGLVFLGFVYDLFAAGNQSGSAFLEGLVPRFDGSESLLLAVGIIGATVMPHVVYLHSALTQRRIVPVGDGERRHLLRFNRIDVAIGLGLAGLINLAMLCIAAGLFHDTGHTEVDTIQEVHQGLESMVGGGAALAFAVALMASGLSSSSVGTYAGQVVMQGFVRRRIPLFVRRAVTMAPALIVLAASVNTTEALVISQVVLSFGIPFALIPLILVTRRRDVMGALVNRPLTTALASAVAGVVICLNVILLVETFGG